MQTAFGGWESTSASTIQLQQPRQMSVPKKKIAPKISVASIIASTHKEPGISVASIIASIDHDTINEDHDNVDEDDKFYNDTNFPTEDPAIIVARKPSANLRRER